MYASMHHTSRYQFVCANSESAFALHVLQAPVRKKQKGSSDAAASRRAASRWRCLCRGTSKRRSSMNAGLSSHQVIRESESRARKTALCCSCCCMLESAG